MKEHSGARPPQVDQTRQQRGPDPEPGIQQGPTHDPRLPHERDESSDQQGPAGQDRRVERAAEDMAAGRQDTSKAAETDQTYQRQKRPG